MRKNKNIWKLLVILFLLGVMALFVFFFVIKPIREITHFEYSDAIKITNKSMNNTVSLTKNNKEILYISKSILGKIKNLKQIINSDEIISQEAITMKLDSICESVNTLTFFFDKNEDIVSFDLINTHNKIFCENNTDINFVILSKEEKYLALNELEKTINTVIVNYQKDLSFVAPALQHTKE